MDVLIKIQGELKAPKDQDNKFGGYKYRSCESILEALKPLLVKYNALLILNDEIEVHGSRVYVKSTATITVGSENKCASGYAREEENKKGMDGSQITGAASSYARKYALNALFLIDDNKDQDVTNKHEAKENHLEVWKSQIDNCKTLEDLESYWRQNTQVVAGDKEIVKLFTNRKKELNNVPVS